MSNLYQLTGQMKELEKLADVDPEIGIAVKDTMEALEGEFNEKAQALATVVLNVDGNIDMIDAEIKRLQEKKKQIQTRKKSMHDYLRENMEAASIKKISCPLFTITLAMGRESVVIDEESEIPDDYVSVETIIKPDKKKIAADIKEGSEVPGAHVEHGQSSIRIK